MRSTRCCAVKPTIQKCGEQLLWMAQPAPLVRRQERSALWDSARSFTTGGGAAVALRRKRAFCTMVGTGLRVSRWPGVAAEAFRSVFAPNGAFGEAEQWYLSAAVLSDGPPPLPAYRGIPTQPGNE